MNKYTLTFETNGGTSIEQVTADYGTLISIENPIKEGYIFDGWYKDESFTTKYIITTMPNENLILYAKWSIIRYKIIYNLDGGRNNSNNPSYYTIETKTIILNDPSKTGSLFIGWYSEPEFINKVEQIEKGTINSVIIYAQWLKLPKTITENGCTYVYYGEYPQTLKQDSVTIISNTPDSNGYYLGSDNERYAKVNAKPYSSAYYFNNNQQIVKGTTYYFKVEPIKWRILQVNGTEYKLVTELIIDNQKFHSSTDTRTIDGKTIYANNYEYSDIRKWLNEDFYTKAFTKELQSIINTTLVDNSLASTGYSSNKNICNDTYDKVYLLSYKDVTNEEYGFTNDVSRQKQVTDYAKAMGCAMDTENKYYNNGDYWLRSPSSKDNLKARIVGSDGRIFPYLGSVAGIDFERTINFDAIGVAPSITINLS